MNADPKPAAAVESPYLISLRETAKNLAASIAAREPHDKANPEHRRGTDTERARLSEVEAEIAKLTK